MRKTLRLLDWIVSDNEWMELREAIRQEITARGGRTR